MNRLLLLALAVASLPAQAVDARRLALDALRIPLHTAPADPTGGAYGLWTAGPNYKASFHDGFAFYPFIPGQERSRAVTWRDTRVRVGDAELPLGASREHTTAWRHELRHAAVIEVYDVRADGVEQSFVITERPLLVGELVIEGDVRSEFHAEACGPRVGALSWCDAAGRAVVEYGAALAYDARGRRIDVATSFDGARLRLHVPAEFVASATYPLVVDPLTSAVVVSSVAGAAAPVQDTAITCSWQQGDFNQLVAVTREFASTDHDAYAYRMTDTGGAPTLIFSDVTASWSTPLVDAAVISGELAWVLALQRDFPARAVRAYVHPINSSTLNSGTTWFLSTSVERGAPSVGGSHGSFVGGRHALLAFTEFGAGGDLAAGVVLDATTGFGALFDLYAGAPSARPSRAPAVNASAHVAGTSAEPWIVAFVEDLGNGTADVILSAVDMAGTVTNTRVLLNGASARGVAIGGADGKYVVTFVDTPALLSSRLRGARVAMTSSSYALVAQRSLLTASAGRFVLNQGVAFDFVTQSHWAVSYATTQLTPGVSSVFVARVGSGLVPLETQTLHASGTQGAANADVAFTGEPHPSVDQGFACSYSTTETNHPAYTRKLGYDPAAAVTVYGTSCRSNSVFANQPPFAGNQSFTVSVSGLPAATAAYCFLGFAPLNLPLDAIGMLGCRMLVDSAVTLPAPLTGTTARVLLPLPDVPVFAGDLFAQFAWLDVGANPLGLVNSRGVQIAVR
jgi:hypothetical protein